MPRAARSCREHSAVRCSFAARLEYVRVIAVGPYLSSAGKEPVDRLGDADGEPLHSPRQRPPLLRLDARVQVVAWWLPQVVHDAHAEPDLRGPEYLFPRVEHPLRPYPRRAGRD